MSLLAERDRSIHEFFNLTYSNYLVLHRSLLQSMPLEWQHKFVRLVEELNDEFDHVETAQCYKVQAAVEADLDSGYTVEELAQHGVRVESIGPEPDMDEEPDEYDDWCEERRYFQDGEEIHFRFLMVTDDPIPPYNRGRTHIATATEMTTQGE